LAVPTRVWTLNRIELVVETLRLSVVALLAAEPEWTRATVPPSWEERYGKRCVAERLSERERASVASRDGTRWTVAVGAIGRCRRQHPPGGTLDGRNPPVAAVYRLRTGSSRVNHHPINQEEQPPTKAFPA